MRILAIDAGLANIGLAVMACRPGPAFVPQDRRAWAPEELQVLRTEADPRKRRIRQADDDVERIASAYGRLSEIVQRLDIKRVAIELPVAGGASAAAVKHMAYASALLACMVKQFDLMAEWYSAGDVRKAVLGRWTSSKAEIQALMEARYPILLEQFPLKSEREHVADALALFDAAYELGNICKP